MITGDFNKDSIIDLVVINSNSDSLSVLLGNGDGTFVAARILLTGNGSRPKEVKTADFNNDTLLDLSMCRVLCDYGQVSIKALFLCFSSCHTTRN